MNENYTEIVVVLDRSGSMESIKTDMEGGLNSFFEAQKGLPGKCLASLYQFDTQYEKVFEGQELNNVPPVVLSPRGGTALLDAIGQTILALGSRLKDLHEDNRPGKVIVVIVTDGEENSSHEFELSKIKEMIKQQTEVYKWQFVFLGANQDAIKTSGSLGIQACNAMTFAPSSEGSAKMSASLSRNISSYRAGSLASPSFSAQDRKLQEDLLGKINGK